MIDKNKKELNLKLQSKIQIIKKEIRSRALKNTQSYKRIIDQSYPLKNMIDFSQSDVSFPSIEKSTDLQYKLLLIERDKLKRNHLFSISKFKDDTQNS